MKIVAKNQTIHSFSADHNPVIKIAPGERVCLEAQDGSGDQITDESQLLTELDLDRLNLCTGPIYVNGAQPKDILKVIIEDIEVSSTGVLCTMPDCGVLIHTIERPKTKIVPVKDNVAYFSEDIIFPVKPMIGTIGVAPADGKDIPCVFPGDHGGNMDNSVISAGATVYFPVNVPGALFALGDLHASMGDGEICGTGIESAGKVTAKFELITGKTIYRPVVETTDKWYTVACDKDISKAIRKACEDMQELLVQAWDMSKTDAFLFISAIGDVEICQAAEPAPIDVVVRVAIPKIKNKPDLIK